MPPTIYHCENMRSLRPIWLCEELNIPYNVKNIPRNEVAQYAQSDEYLELNPLAKFPTMTDGDITMVESIAIMEYILLRYGDGKLTPAKTSNDYAAYLQWLHFGESGMGLYVSMLLGHTYLLPEEHRIPRIAKWAKGETDKCLQFISKGLGDQEYLCTSGFTAADISCTYMMLLLKLIKQFDDAPENIQSYWKRMSARPAWVNASSL